MRGRGRGGSGSKIVGIDSDRGMHTLKTALHFSPQQQEQAIFNV